MSGVRIYPKPLKNGRWAVLADGQVMKIFSSKAFADVYIMDSAHDDWLDRKGSYSRDLKPETWDRLRVPVRVVETGKVYPSVCACADALGVEQSTVGAASRTGNIIQKCGVHIERLSA